MKKLLIAVAAVLVAFTSCDKKEAKPDSGVTATKIAFAEKSYTVVAGETVALKLVAEPENASLAGVQFASKKEEIATVDKDGVVTAVSAGTTTVIATLGELKATAKIIVEAVPVPATGIKVEPSEVTVMAGKSVTVKASLLPENTTDKLDATWSSADASIAAVDGGVIRGVAEGSTTVTVKHGDFSATVKVTVEASSIKDRSADWTMTHASRWQQSYSGATAVVDVTLSVCDAEKFYFRILGEGETFDLETLVAAVEAKKQEAEGYGDDPASLFASEVPAKQTSYRMGEQTAYVLAYDAELNFADEYAVYNFTAVEPDPVPATGITITPETLTLKEGKREVITAVLTPEDATDSPDNIQWTSSDESVATVQVYYANNAAVTAVAEGTATITATLGELTATCVVTVEKDMTVWTDRSADWTWSVGDVDYYGEVTKGFILETCDSPSHVLVGLPESYLSYYGITGDPLSVETVRSLAAQYESGLSYYASDVLPDGTPFYGYGMYYFYVLGVADNAFNGDYMVIKYEYKEGGDTPDPDDPDDPAGEGNIVKLDGQYFPVDWSESDATLDNVTFEAWVNSSSFSGGKDNIYTIMGTEGIFMLRCEGGQLNLVYGGAQREGSSEYSEMKVTYNTNLETGKWYHVAATYSRGGDVILYVNGEQVGSNTAEDHAIEMNGVGAEWVLPFKFYVGVSSNTRVWKGSLAYLRVWNGVRSADQIKANMKVEEPELGNQTLLASWYFTEGKGNTIADQSSSAAYPLTANSDLTWVKGTLPFGGEIPESSNGNVPDYGTVPGFQW